MEINSTGVSIVSQKIIVRTANFHDYSAIARLCNLVQEIHVRNRPDIFKSLTMDGLVSWIAGVFVDSTRQFWVATVDGVVVGYALTVECHAREGLFTREMHWTEIEQISVLPSHQKQGVARILIERIKQSLNKESAELQLNTYGFNETARTAFARLGFVERHLRLETVVSKS